MKKKDIAQIKEEDHKLNLKQKKIIYIVGSVAFVIFAVALSTKLYLNSQSQKAITKAESFLQNLDQNNFDQAYSLLSKDQKESSSADVFTFNNEINRNSLGSQIERSSNSTKAKIKNGKVEITVTFSSKFESDSIAEEVVVFNINLF